MGRDKRPAGRQRTAGPTLAILGFELCDMDATICHRGGVGEVRASSSDRPHSGSLHSRSRLRPISAQALYELYNIPSHTTLIKLIADLALI